MLSLTRKADYALVAMADLACQEPARVSAREIAERSHLPLPVLTNILKRLTRQGLVTSTRGAKGGYRLARGPGQITLADLIHAVESPIRFARCCHTEEADDESVCDKEDVCRIKGPVRRVNQSLREFLGQVTLAHIAWDTVPIGIECAGSGSGSGHHAGVTMTEPRANGEAAGSGRTEG